MSTLSDNSAPFPVRTVTATFEDGVLKPSERLNLPAHAEVRLTIEPVPASRVTVGELVAFLGNLPSLGDDSEAFAHDLRAIRSEFVPEMNSWD